MLRNFRCITDRRELFYQSFSTKILPSPAPERVGENRGGGDYLSRKTVHLVSSQGLTGQHSRSCDPPYPHTPSPNRSDGPYGWSALQRDPLRWPFPWLPTHPWSLPNATPYLNRPQQTPTILTKIEQLPSQFFSLPAHHVPMTIWFHHSPCALCWLCF